MSDAWIERQLVDIVGLDKGVTYASSDYSDVNEGLPFFTIKCVQKGGGFNWSGVKFYSGPFLPNQALKCGDILLALTATSPEPGTSLAVQSLCRTFLVQIRYLHRWTSVSYGLLRIKLIPHSSITG